jgi:hypothetical protein
MHLEILNEYSILIRSQWTTCELLYVALWRTGHLNIPWAGPEYGEGQPGRNLRGALEHNGNKSEIWCQLTQVSTRDSLNNWQYVNAKRKSVFPAPTQTLDKCLQNIGLKGRKIISLPGAPTCLCPALEVGLVHLDWLLLPDIISSGLTDVASRLKRHLWGQNWFNTANVETAVNGGSRDQNTDLCGRGKHLMALKVYQSTTGLCTKIIYVSYNDVLFISLTSRCMPCNLTLWLTSSAFFTEYLWWRLYVTTFFVLAVFKSLNSLRFEKQIIFRLRVKKERDLF